MGSLELIFVGFCTWFCFLGNFLVGKLKELIKPHIISGFICLLSDQMDLSNSLFGLGDLVSNNKKEKKKKGGKRKPVTCLDCEKGRERMDS